MSERSGVMHSMTGDIIWPQGWRVDIGSLPAGFYGVTHFRQRRSVIAPDLHPWMHRAVMLHESIHAHDGPVPRFLEIREERRVHRETARRLIPLDALVHAMQATTDARVAAGWLEVPESMIWARLQGLHPAERAAVRRDLENHHAAG